MSATDKYAEEVGAMASLPPRAIELPPLAALAIITHIQLACRHPLVDRHPLTQMAIDCAKQLQDLFNPESVTYQVLELGWNPDEDRPVGELTHKKAELKEAIKNYFQYEGIDLDQVENSDEESFF